MKKYNVTVNNVLYEVTVEEVHSFASPAPAAAPKAATFASPAAPKAEPAPVPQKAVPANGYPVTAPMPGSILDVKVSVGVTVKKGDVLVILEAMKMENDVVSPADGQVVAVRVSKGSSVNAGDVLILIG
ncbi:MAG TPA: acetyl-CoA carboxylase biotin carboxyl carrier protein subunit [Clostridiales bacterium]|nr:acetyl-CoA carboxylase biotin carboxyl carrier protein subunit [Clostridiales bacterium]